MYAVGQLVEVDIWESDLDYRGPGRIRFIGPRGALIQEGSLPLAPLPTEIDHWWVSRKDLARRVRPS